MNLLLKEPMGVHSFCKPVTPVLLYGFNKIAASGQVQAIHAYRTLEIYRAFRETLFKKENRPLTKSQRLRVHFCKVLHVF